MRSSTPETEAALLPEEQQLRSKGQLIQLSIGFVFVFSALSCIQSLASSILPGVGFSSLASLYLTFGIANIYSGSYVKNIGSRRGLWIGTIGYLILDWAYFYVAASENNSLPHLTILLILSSIVTGAAASVLWSSHGLFLTQVHGDIGTNTGVFFGIFMTNSLIGNLSAGVLLQFEFDIHLVFGLFALVAILGFVVLLGLKSLPTSTLRQNHAVSSNDFVLLHSSLFKLIPLFIISGTIQAFYNGSFPLFIPDLSTKLYVMTILFFSNSLCSLFNGKYVDRFGTKNLLRLNAFVILLTLILLCLREDKNLYALSGVACLLGFCDSALTTIIYATISKRFEKQTIMPSCFSFFKFYQTVATAGFFLVSEAMLDENRVPRMDYWAPIFVLQSFIVLVV